MNAGTDRMVVYFFSDVEGSTKLWERHPEAMRSVIGRHDQLIDGLIETHGGRVVDHAGDGVFAVFEDGTPLACALQIQRTIQAEHWDEIEELRVRMGLHAGQVASDRTDDRGPLANRTARIMDAGHGGQILLSQDVLDYCDLPEGAQAEDLGSHELKDLTDPQPIYQLTHPELALRQFPALRSLSAHPHNLPTQTTPFVGRERELATVTQHLTGTDQRLVTLLGPGGVGKTRLAIQAAAEPFEAFPDGVFFVPLDAVPTVDAVVDAIADALGFTFYSNEDPQVQIRNYLERKTLLLVLDNCEHLSGVNALVGDLLDAAPQLTVLATSRARLNLKGELVFDLYGLDVPESPSVADLEAYSALRLFVDSAQRARADFTADEDNLPHIVRVCRLLNGMPLGIELAAAWVRMLPVDEIAEEIEANLDFLESAYEDLPERQRSLRAVFDYSWALLSEQEQAAFADLSVFRGDFDRVAAKGVAGVSMMALASLVDKSLLRTVDEGRYGIHSLLRQYAEERLAQDLERHRRALQQHGDYFADRMAQWVSDLVGERQVEALHEIQQAFDDVRFMWQTALEQEAWSRIDRSLQGLYLFCAGRSRFQEGRRLLDAALQAVEETTANPEDRDTLKGHLQARLGRFHHVLGQNEVAEQLLRNALAVARESEDQAEVAFTLNTLGMLLIWSDPQTAEAFCDEAFAISQANSLDAEMADSLHNLGIIELLKGDLETSRERTEQGLAIRRRLNDKRGMSKSLGNLGLIERRRGHTDEARRLYEQSLETSRDLGDQEGMAKVLGNLGLIEWQQGDLTKSRELHQQSLAIVREIGDKQAMARNLGNLGVLEWHEGNLDRSRALLQQRLDIGRELGDQRGVAQCLHNLGNVELAQGDIDKARGLFEESLTIGRDQSDMAIVVDNLTGLASVLHHEHRNPEAAQLQGTIRALLAQTDAPLDRDEQDLYEQTADALSESLGETAYREAVEAGRALSLEDAIELAASVLSCRAHERSGKLIPRMIAKKRSVCAGMSRRSSS